MQNIPYEKFGLRNITNGFTLTSIKTIDLDGYNFSFNGKPAYLYIRTENGFTITNPFTITVTGKNILGNIVSVVINVPAGGFVGGDYFGTDGFSTVNTIELDPNGNTSIDMGQIDMMFDMSQVATVGEVTKSLNNPEYSQSFNGDFTHVINLDCTLNSPENDDPNVYLRGYSDADTIVTIHGEDINLMPVTETVTLPKEKELRKKLSKAFSNIISVEGAGVDTSEPAISTIIHTGTGNQDLSLGVNDPLIALGDYSVEILNKDLNFYTAYTTSPVPFNDGDVVYGVTSGETGIVRFHSNGNYILIERTSANDFTDLEEIRVSPDTGASTEINVTGQFSDLFEFTTPNTSQKGACHYDMILDDCYMVFNVATGHEIGDTFTWTVNNVLVSNPAGHGQYTLEKIQNKIAGMLNYKVNVIDFALSKATEALGDNIDCNATCPTLLSATTFGSFKVNPYQFNWVIESRERDTPISFYVYSVDTPNNTTSNSNYESIGVDDYFTDYNSPERVNLININFSDTTDENLGFIDINISEFTEEYVSPYPLVILDNEEQKFALVLDRAGDEYSAIGWFTPQEGGIKQYLDIPLNASGANVTMSKSFINNSPRFSLETFN